MARRPNRRCRRGCGRSASKPSNFLCSFRRRNNAIIARRRYGISHYIFCKSCTRLLPRGATKMSEPFAGWDGSIAGARTLQAELAKQVRLEDEFPRLRVIAGVDVGFEEAGAITRAAAVLLNAMTLQPLAQAIARVPTRMPYVPGLLSFRELPALLDALDQLPQTPDLVFVDGQGIAHPRGLGIAAHLGVVCGLATIGVAKSILVGTHGEIGMRRGDRAALRYRERIIGTVLRTKDNVRS